MAAPNPFDPATVLFAKHAQHVVLIHFPIALFTVGVTLDLAAEWSRRRGLADNRAAALAAAAYYNLLLAAIFAVPVVVTGDSGLAIRSRGATPERDSARASGFGLRFKHPDLGFLVVSLFGAKAQRSNLQHSTSCGNCGCDLDFADWPFGRVPERGQRGLGSTSTDLKLL